jgi:hypothetical protein
MFRLIIAAVSAALLLFGKPASASVTFDFFETGITVCRAISCGPQQFSPPFPILMTLQLSDTTETGSAEYNALAVPRFGPVVSDPNFIFSLFVPGIHGLDNLQTAGPDFGRNNANLISYDITWNEVSGQLTALSVNYQDVFNEVGYGAGPFGVTGGGIGSDGFVGGCSGGTCTITGYWQRVPEPGSAALFLTALFGFGALRRRYRP